MKDRRIGQVAIIVGFVLLVMELITPWQAGLFVLVGLVEL